MAKIILLHGLHMHSWVMKPLAYLLEQEGFEVALFDYYSVLHSMNRHVKDLSRWIDENHADETLHFVGHSLGGLVLRNFSAAYPDKVSGRIVTMGTPHQGSRAAQRVLNLGLQKPVLGGSYKGALDGSMPELPEGVELGSIAGNKPYGLGRVLGLHGEHDGTVLVSETHCPNMRDHVVLPLSHSGMLFNRKTVGQVVAFLHDRCFKKQ